MAKSDYAEVDRTYKNDRLRTALAKIAKMASTAIDDGEDFDGDKSKTGWESASASQEDMPGCVIKFLPPRLLIKAAEIATTINPSNAPAVGPLASVMKEGQEITRLELAVVTSKYWGPAQRRLTVSFMDSAPTDLRVRIISHMNAWCKTSGISFVETLGVGDVRISRGPGGYWSYLGTDINLIPKNRPTMNLQDFTMNTVESEFRRVVRHEAGHTLGFPHEHMRKALVARIDPEKAYIWFEEKYKWPKAMVDAQVLTPLDEASLMGTPADKNSIMCYQLPGEITKDGRPIPGGADINQTDYAFAGKIYPKLSYVAAAQEDEWWELEEVEMAA
ncbi:MAG: M12 family metallopeptidase [Blastocatellia bacterium]